MLDYGADSRNRQLASSTGKRLDLCTPFALKRFVKQALAMNNMVDINSHLTMQELGALGWIPIESMTTDKLQSAIDYLVISGLCRESRLDRYDLKRVYHSSIGSFLQSGRVQQLSSESLRKSFMQRAQVILSWDPATGVTQRADKVMVYDFSIPTPMFPDNQKPLFHPASAKTSAGTTGHATFQTTSPVTGIAGTIPVNLSWVNPGQLTGHIEADTPYSQSYLGSDNSIEFPFHHLGYWYGRRIVNDISVEADATTSAVVGFDPVSGQPKQISRGDFLRRQNISHRLHLGGAASGRTWNPGAVVLEDFNTNRFTRSFCKLAYARALDVPMDLSITQHFTAVEDHNAMLPDSPVEPDEGAVLEEVEQLVAVGEAVEKHAVSKEAKLQQLLQACKLVHGENGFCQFYKPCWGSFNPRIFMQQPYKSELTGNATL